METSNITHPLYEATQELKPLIAIYRNFYLGPSNISASTTLEGNIRDIENDRYKRLTEINLQSVRSAIDYRMSLMGQATRYKDYLDGGVCV